MTDPESTIVATLGAVAQHFGRALSTVKGWRQAGCPGTPGAFDLAAIDAWLRSSGRQTGAEAQAAMIASATAEAVRRLAAAEREQLRLGREVGDVLTSDDLRRRLAVFVAEMIERLDAVVEFIAKRCTPSDRNWLRNHTVPDFEKFCSKLINEPFACETAETSIIAVATKLGRGEPLIAKSASRRRKP